MKKFLVALLIALCSLHIGVSEATASVPKYEDYITDTADILSNENEQQLEKKLKQYDEQTTNQIAVLTIDSLEGIDIESYSIEVVEDWKIGTEDKDNGILLLIVEDTNSARIEVGYGLEGDVTDIESKHILDEASESLKNGSYDEATVQITDNIISSIDSEFMATEVEGETVNPLFIVVIIVLIILDIMFFEGTFTNIFLMILLTKGSSSKTKFKGGGFGGGGASI